MENIIVRDYARQFKVRHWQIAERMNIDESVFSRKLRHELPKNEQADILRIIREIAGENDDG